MQPFIANERLIVYECTIDDLFSIGQLAAEKPTLSTQDCSVL
jgi:hypothetical protein